MAPRTPATKTAPRSAPTKPSRGSAKKQPAEQKTGKARRLAKPNPELPPGQKRRKGAGRKVGEAGNFVPTEEQRKVVEVAAGARMPQEQICLLIINPANGKPISHMTLKKAFEDEIQRGYAKVRLSIHQAKLKAALEGNPTMIIWAEKTMFGIREHVDIVDSPVDNESKATDVERARRIAFALSLGARQVTRAASTALDDDEAGE